MLQERAPRSIGARYRRHEIRRHGIARIRFDGDKPPSRTTRPVRCGHMYTAPPPARTSGSEALVGIRRAACLTRGACAGSRLFNY